MDGDSNGSALCDTGAYEVGAAPAAQAVTITYAYDPLYRLTAATYSSGSVFTYTHDAVGNRLTQQTLSGTVSYVYDNANRLTNAGGITYAWDANGNLLNDGASGYAYDAANRLITVTQGLTTSTFAYNGLGDRLRQSVNAVPTTHTLDLNMGLTQVLSDGSNTYLYGNGRIAQHGGTNTAYFLGDALGSVRQLATITGSVTLVRSYEPFGEVLSSAGPGVTNYAFTGELRDATGLIYLRARYYSRGTGRFISKDIWPGDYTRPLSLNGFSYVEGNPVNQIDPTGMLTNDQISRGFSFSPGKFGEVVYWFSKNAPKNWALLAALQDAQHLDRLGVGVDDLIANEWFVGVVGDNVYLIEKNGSHNYNSLLKFAQDVTNKNLRDIPNPVLYSYGDNRINMYFVNGMGRAPEKGYKAFNSWYGGWMRTPDLKGVSGSLPIPGVKVQLGVGGGYQIIMDRYGYARITVEGGAGIGVSFIAGAQGWVTRYGDQGRKLDEPQLAQAIEKWSLNSSGAVGTSRGISWNLGAYQIWWQGEGVSLHWNACSLSYTWQPFVYSPEAAWDWVDTSRGYTIHDIRLK